MKLKHLLAASVLAAGVSLAADEAVNIPGSQYELPGILAVPEGEADFAAVLLIRGFAGDENEVGGCCSNLAAQLAERGIGSLRAASRDSSAHPGAHHAT